MDLPVNLRPRIKLNTITHVRRSLIGGKGKLNVAPNQEVMSSDILGQSMHSAGFSAVNIAKNLGVSSNVGGKYLTKPIGSKIFKGELLGLKKGMFGDKVVTAPSDGVLAEYDSKLGEVMLEFLPKQQPLTSGVFGIVEQVNTDIGEVVIKTSVTEIIGIYGCGKERGGDIEAMGSSSELLSMQMLSHKLSSKIILGGALIYGEALRKAVECGISGIISGGINSLDFKAMSGSVDPHHRIGTDPGISILSTEGFGSMSIGSDIYNIIRAHDGKFAFLNGNTARLLLPSPEASSIINLRKVALPITKEAEGSSDVTFRMIEPGARVRIVWPPFAGWQGRVISIDKTPTQLPSGISTYLLVVETSRKKIMVPYLNVELVA